MAHHRRLRTSGGARRELQDDRVVLGDRCLGEAGIRGEGEQVCEVVLDHDRGTPGSVPSRRGQAASVCDQQGRGGGLEPIFDLAAGPPAVEADSHSTHGRTGPEGDDVLGAVGGEDRHPVAVSNPPIGEGRCHRSDLSLEALERQDTSLTGIVEHRIIGIAVTGSPGQHVAQGPGPVHEHLHRLPQDLLGRDLEEAAGAGEGGRGLLVGQRGVATRVGIGPGHVWVRHSMSAAPTRCAPG